MKAFSWNDSVRANGASGFAEVVKAYSFFFFSLSGSIYSGKVFSCYWFACYGRWLDANNGGGLCECGAGREEEGARA